jgi:hypothetical protein
MAAAVLVEVGVAILALILVTIVYDLVRSRRTPKSSGDVELTALRTSYSPAEVDILRGLLEANGIPSMVSSDDASGWRPDGMWRPQRLLVRTADRARAEELIAEVAADASTDPPSH